MVVVSGFDSWHTYLKNAVLLELLVQVWVLGHIDYDTESVVAQDQGQLIPFKMTLSSIAGAIQQREAQHPVNLLGDVTWLQHDDLYEA